MPVTCRDIYDNKSQLLHQVGTSRHFHIWCTVTHTSKEKKSVSHWIVTLMMGDIFITLEQGLC